MTAMGRDITTSSATPAYPNDRYPPQAEFRFFVGWINDPAYGATCLKRTLAEADGKAAGS